MNTRIAELVAAEMDEYWEGAYIDSACARDQLMRFAERIVRECANLVNSDMDHYNSIAYITPEEIKEHFGVE